MAHDAGPGTTKGEQSEATSLLDTMPPCPVCGYDLRGCPSASCSECGTAFTATAVVPRRPSALGVIILLVGAALPVGTTLFLAVANLSLAASVGVHGGLGWPGLMLGVALLALWGSRSMLSREHAVVSRLRFIPVVLWCLFMLYLTARSIVYFQSFYMVVG